MKTENVIYWTAAAIFLCSAGTCNAAYEQRDRQQFHTTYSVLVQQLDREQGNYYTDQLSTPEVRAQHRQEYCELKTESTGEKFRHRHQLKKGANETGGGKKNQKGSGGAQKGSGGAQKGSGGAQKGSGGAQKGGGRK